MRSDPKATDPKATLIRVLQHSDLDRSMNLTRQSTMSEEREATPNLMAESVTPRDRRKTSIAIPPAKDRIACLTVNGLVFVNSCISRISIAFAQLATRLGACGQDHRQCRTGGLLLALGSRRTCFRFRRTRDYNDLPVEFSSVPEVEDSLCAPLLACRCSP